MHARSSSRRDFLHIVSGLAAASALGGGSWRAFTQEPGAPAAPAPPKPLERRKLGKTDMEVALLGFGSAEIGYERVEQASVDKLLGAALDAGLNVIDTAECYVDSEVLIGKAVAHRRTDFHLFTKCGHIEADGSSGSDWSKPAILASLERSLKRLKTDAVDLLQLHSCSQQELEKGECIEALEQAKKEGKTRYIGYSGDSRAALFAIESGRFDTLQTSVNLCDQECIELTLPKARERGLGVIAKRPIANAVWRHDKLPESGYHQEYWRRLQALGYEFARGEARERQDADGPAGIALRFTAMQPGVHVLIVGTTKPERWKQNAALLRAGPLPAELERKLRERWKEVAQPDWVGQT